MANDEDELVIPEEPGRLRVVEHNEGEIELDLLLQSLREDLVVLIRNVSPEQADRFMYDVADRFRLSDSLKLQAGFAGFAGHRHNIGKYFMSVNKREDYQFVPPHSEGSSFIGMQLASFFCYENSTDGGETILMNTDDSSEAWQSLREKARRGRIGPKPLTQQEILRARGLYRLNLPTDILREDDQVLEESRTEFPSLTVVDVLAKPQRFHSSILDRKLYVYWDTIGSIDKDSAPQYARLLRQCGLLKEPKGGLQVHQMDSSAQRRIWHSGVSYAGIFKCKITCKLEPGDFIIQNNLTWTHSANNWSPDSGTRKIAASFA
ncbi:MAG: TauD/TfdA family dioxygenase [Acidobacteriota bacterium]|nr:TauD/TfdA family dioxygenase [Acidobacteriota bacterium]